jgi:hypothetical protein
VIAKPVITVGMVIFQAGKKDWDSHHRWLLAASSGQG